MSARSVRIALGATIMLFVAARAHAQSSPGAATAQTAQEQPKPAATHEDHAARRDDSPRQAQLAPGLPPVTDEDRAAAFPEVNGQHAVHDGAVHYYVLFDQLEWQTGSGLTAGSWDNRGWIGRDVHRLWFRTEGEAEDGDVAAQAHALFGRAIHPWWDMVVGVRQDFGPGPQRTWAAVGIQGLAPYWFHVEATAYFGGAAQTHFRIETEYELLFTNRLILQPLVELDIHGVADPERGVGAGLSSGETGLRLRYEFRREIAPYVGVTWNRKFFGTAEVAEAAGEHTASTRLALGLRIWF